ncbi:hypothetical protein [Streptomyces sp. NPDC057494]|uniref:hypothetical protein n=1 Tax=Streptomyces sp. NPDC057494 TaxID=3346148 RepID=UPI0036C96E3D
MLFAVRDGVPGGQITGLPQLLLGRIDSAALDAFLGDRVATLSPYAREQIIEQAQGNPLALLELPAALTAQQRATSRVSFAASGVPQRAASPISSPSVTTPVKTAAVAPRPSPDQTESIGAEPRPHADTGWCASSALDRMEMRRSHV